MAVLGLLLLSATSCMKEEVNRYDLTIVITVDGDIRTQNALVHIYAPVAETFIDFFAYSDENGEIEVNLKNKAILQLVAQKGSFRGCNVAEINRGTQTVYVDVKPFGVENGCEGID